MPFDTGGAGEAGARHLAAAERARDAVGGLGAEAEAGERGAALVVRGAGIEAEEIVGDRARGIEQRHPLIEQRERHEGARAALPRGERSGDERERSEEHTSEPQSLMRLSSAVFCL